MAENFGPKKTPLTDFKLRLSADPVNGAKRRPSLAWSNTKKGPQVTIYTNVESEPNNGIIKQAFDLPMFFALIDAIEEAAASEGEFKVTVDCEDYTWQNRQRSDSPSLQSKVIVGRDAAGFVYLAVTSPKVNTKVQFKFKVPYLYKMIDSDGSQMSDAKASARFARAYARTLKEIAAMDFYHNWVEPQQKNGNGGGNNNNSGGGYASQTDTTDVSDIF